MVSAHTGTEDGQHVWSQIEALFPEGGEVEVFSFKENGDGLLSRALEAIDVVDRASAGQRSMEAEGEVVEAAGQAAEASVDEKDNPPVVKDPWQSVWDEGQQRYYFYNSRTRTSSWSIPE